MITCPLCKFAYVSDIGFGEVVRYYEDGTTETCKTYCKLCLDKAHTQLKYNPESAENIPVICNDSWRFTWMEDKEIDDRE